MKNKSCPDKIACWYYEVSNCEGCEIGEKIARLARQNKKLKAENAEFRHRAKVAERALINMTKKYNLAERKIATTKDGWFGLGEAQIALLADEAIKEAEKELAEEEGRNV